MAIVIEIINRSGHVQHCQVFDKESITIGRAYTNDVIIADPYIDPVHASISIIDDNERGFYFSCDDLSSTNGISDSKGHKQAATSHWQAGQVVSLGKTLIRINSTTATVPTAVRLSAWEQISDSLSRARAIILVSLCCLLLITADTYLSSFSVQNKTAEYAIVVYLLLSIVVYAGIFAFLGKALRQDSRFWLYYTLVGLSIIFIALYDLLADLIFFNLNLGISHWFDPIIYALVIALLVYFSIQSASSFKVFTRIAIASIVPGLIIINLAINVSRNNEFNWRPQYDVSAYFQHLYFAKSDTQQEVLDASKALYRQQ